MRGIVQYPPDDHNLDTEDMTVKQLRNEAWSLGLYWGETVSDPPRVWVSRLRKAELKALVEVTLIGYRADEEVKT